MATVTNMGTVHMFPSTASYNSNKTSLGTNDIALVPAPRFPIETNSSGRNWFIKYNDGWIEQGGELTWASTRSALGKVINFNTQFTNAESIQIDLTPIITGSYNAPAGIRNATITTSNVTVNVYGLGSSDRTTGVHWRACGY